LVFDDDSLDAMLRVRAAFDPAGLCNPGKIIPVLKGCGEARAVAQVKAAGGEGRRREANAEGERQEVRGKGQKSEAAEARLSQRSLPKDASASRTTPAPISQRHSVAPVSQTPSSSASQQVSSVLTSNGDFDVERACGVFARVVGDEHVSA